MRCAFRGSGLLALSATTLLLATAAAACGESGPGPPSDDVAGTIVYSYGEAVEGDGGVGLFATDGLAVEIRLMNADGSHRRTIADLREVDQEVYHPAWSPDGSKIVFGKVVDHPADIYTQAHLYVMNSDGSGQRLLSRRLKKEYVFPVWSPDGSKIAFVREEPRGTTSQGLYVMTADGRSERRLARFSDDLLSSEDAIHPDWSPDGRIVYASESGIYSIKPDGRGKRLLVDEADNPSWSPNGRKLAFAREGQIYVMNADGTGQRRLTDLDPETGLSPIDTDILGIDWSPDGSWIVFAASLRYGRSDIYLVKPDGSDLARLTTSGWNVHPDWGPISGAAP